MGVVKFYTDGEKEENEYGSFPGSCKWAAYHYAAGCYDGSGEALVAWEDGTFSFHDMSHCSCNSAWDDLSEYNRKRLTWDQVVALIGKDDNGKEPLWNEEHWAGMWRAAAMAAREQGLKWPEAAVQP